MLGILNVLYENSAAELHYYYRALADNARKERVAYRLFIADNSRESRRDLVPADAAYGHFPQNLGYTRAANLLTEEALAAGCDLVLATNLDGFVLPGCLTNLLATFNAHAGNALVEARQFPREHRKTYDRATGATNWVTGCCLLVNRSIVQRLGPYDEALFLYAEDVDYSFRARRAGIACVVSETALFFHRHFAPITDPVKLRHQFASGRYMGLKWRQPEMQRLWEQRMIGAGFIASREELPELPRDIATYPCPVAWDARGTATFASQRWEI